MAKKIKKESEDDIILIHYTDKNNINSFSIATRGKAQNRSLELIMSGMTNVNIPSFDFNKKIT